MTDQTPQGGPDQSERLDQARAVYARIFQALQASLDRLASGEETTADARNRQDLFRAHLKQLQSVFEIEGNLDTFGAARGAARIDLEDARREIRERLDRISGR